MLSAKQVLDRVFVERCNITKDIHRNKFEYLVEVKGWDGDWMPMCVLESNTGGKDSSDIVFEVVNQELFVGLVNSPLVDDFIHHNILRCFETVLSFNLIYRTLDDEDLEITNKVRDIIDIIESIKPTKTDMAMGIYGRADKDDSDFVDDNYNDSINYLRMAVYDNISRNYHYSIKSFSIDENNILSLNITFSADFNANPLVRQSEIPITIKISVDNFSEDSLIDGVSSFVKRSLDESVDGASDGILDFTDGSLDMLVEETIRMLRALLDEIRAITKDIRLICVVERLEKCISASEAEAVKCGWSEELVKKMAKDVDFMLFEVSFGLKDIGEKCYGYTDVYMLDDCLEEMERLANHLNKSL